MPGLIKNPLKSRKRKREIGPPTTSSKKGRRFAQEEALEDSQEARILFLEQQILESRRHYNSIVTLLGFAQDGNLKTNALAAVSLCRIFCRLMAAGSLTKTRNSADGEGVIVQWLHAKYQEFQDALLGFLAADDFGKQSMALTLLMRLIKEQNAHLKLGGNVTWKDGLFTRILKVLLESKTADEARVRFVDQYVDVYDDVRYYTFYTLGHFELGDAPDYVLDNALSILERIDNVPEKQAELETFYVSPPSKPKHSLRSLVAHKTRAQEAWLSVLRRDISKSQRKIILGLISQKIAPWFLKLELLMDFLTDSFNIGGSTSLMALSGLFHLIQEKNLDYPQFYLKLYSLLDADILHSKHRSRFFRLLDQFLASTHLPAILVASFIKKLSRLALHSPPSGIVVIVPWIYNILKNHPSCTFMIHREVLGTDERQDLEERGTQDPFRMEEPDPMQTDAIESSLWEIEMLQSHYHPNVATIAKIISEQFTKQSYNIEDFLDHSYASMLDAELSKDIKKPPVVEYEIPKRIFTKADANLGQEDSLLVKLWDFS